MCKRTLTETTTAGLPCSAQSGVLNLTTMETADGLQRPFPTPAPFYALLEFEQVELVK